jgi:parallel beta-helix repeat protein
MHSTHPSHSGEAHHPDTLVVPPDRRALLAGIGGLAAGALLVGARTAQAGPLNPPAGPVASTGKTLMEVEPRIAINSTNTPGSSATSSVFRITQPGSYYLTGNVISSIVNRHVIVVAASGVTIDLNGFLIRGLGTVQGAFDGIFAEAGVERVTVRNGHIELAGRDGINFQNARHNLIENVSAQSCVRVGITSGTDSIVSHCVAVSNVQAGIHASSSTSVSGCTATSNGGSGVISESGCIITNSTARNNALRGIATATSCIVSHCTSNSNTLSGIEAGIGCTISNCTTSNNGSSGMFGDIANTVVACTAYENALRGIRVGFGSTVVDCSARLNGEYGISCNGDCTIRGNTCSDNGTNATGGNIFASFDGDNRIEDNNCSGAFRGIEVASTGNIIVRNTCAGNTLNYDIAANNRYGPIINITGTGTAAVNGNSATSTIGSTDPHANFAY